MMHQSHPFDVHKWVLPNAVQSSGEVWDHANFCLHKAAEFPVGAYGWICIFIVLGMCLRLILRPHRVCQREQDLNKVVTQIINILVSTLLLVAMLPGLHVLLRGTFHDVATLDSWDDTISWVQSHNYAAMVGALGILPLVSWYLVEMAYISMTSSSETLLLSHHALAMVLLLVGSLAMNDTLDFHYFRIGYVMLLHIALEQPCFVGILLHRFYNYRSLASVPNRDIFLQRCRWVDHYMRGMIVYTIVFRLLVTSAAIACWYDMTFHKVVQLEWDSFFSVFLPTCIAFISVAQASIIHIYIRMLRQRLQRAKDLTENRSRTSQKAENSMIEFQAKMGRTQANPTTHKPPRTTTRSGSSASAFVSVSIVLLCGITALVLLCVRPLSSHVKRVRAQRIAVVGGGASGMAAAWRLAESTPHSVVVFERAPDLGGAAKSHYYYESGAAVDTGFRAFQNYHNFESLLQLLEIDTLRSGVSSVTVSNDPEDEFVMGPALSRSKVEAEADTIARFAPELARFAEALEEALNTWTTSRLMQTPLGEFMRGHKFQGAFSDTILRSCLAIYVASHPGDETQGLFNAPVGFIAHLESEIGACTMLGRKPIKHIQGGAGKYAQRFAAFIETAGAEIRTNTKVEKVERSGAKWIVRTDSGDVMEFDQVIFAGVSDSWSWLLEEEFRPPTASDSHYSICTGASGSAEPWLSPNLRDSDGCWNIESYNFMMHSGGHGKMYGVGYMPEVADFTRCLRSPPGPINIYGSCETLRATAERTGAKIDVLESWSHPTHDVDYFERNRNLHKWQGRHGLWFIGGDTSIQFHENAIVSGFVVASQLGASYPFAHNARAKQFYVALQNWMLYGINFITPRLSSHQSSVEASRASSHRGGIHRSTPQYDL